MIKPLLKKSYYNLLNVVGADRRVERRVLAEGSVVVLNLHRVTTDQNPFWPALHPHIFEELVRYVSKRFDVVSLEEAQSRRPRGRPMAILSFDDGYLDFIEFALPIMKKIGVVSNLNIIPECALSGKPIWNVRLYDFLQSASPSLLREIKMPEFSNRYRGHSDSEKLRFGLSISRFLKSRPRAERLRLLSGMQPKFDEIGGKGTRMMSVRDIRSVSDTVEIGAHSYSHESMGFESDEYFLHDVNRCKTFFSDKLKLSLSTYAFPNGSYRTAQIGILRANGIKNILLVDEKITAPVEGVFTRRTIYGTTAIEARMRALGY